MRKNMVLALLLTFTGSAFAQAQQDSLLPLILLGGSQGEHSACQRSDPTGTPLLPLLLLGGSPTSPFGGSTLGFGNSLDLLTLSSNPRPSRCRRTGGHSRGYPSSTSGYGDSLF